MHYSKALLLGSTTVAAVTLALMLAGGLPRLIGFDTFVVAGGSMGDAVPRGSIVVADRVAPSAIRAGDIITFRRPAQPDIAVTHRVVGVKEPIDGASRFETMGDANATGDPEEVITSRPVSRMVYMVPFAGYVVQLGRSLAGRMLLVVAPLSVIVGLMTRDALQHRRVAADGAGVVDAGGVGALR